MSTANENEIESQVRNRINGASHSVDSLKDGGIEYQEQFKQSHMVSQVFHPEFNKIGNPGPLGLLSFSVTAMMLGLYHCGAGLPNLDPNSGIGPDNVIGPVSFWTGGVAQFAAGMWELRVGNTFGATIHTMYASFWLSYAGMITTWFGVAEGYKGDERALTFQLGIYLIVWAFLTLTFILAALNTNFPILTALVFVFLAFLFLALSNFLTTMDISVSSKLGKAGGAFAFLAGFAAFYGGIVGIMLPEHTMVTLPLPLVPWGPKLR